MYYVIYTCIVAKYGMIMLSYKTYAYRRFFLVYAKRISSIPDSNRFTREFSVRRSAVIRIDESDRGRSLQVTMILVHFEFLGAGLHGTLNHGVSVALSEPN